MCIRDSTHTHTYTAEKRPLVYSSFKMALATCKLEYTCTLSEETLNIAMKELNEDPATRLIEMKTFAERLLRYPGKCAQKTNTPS